MGDSVRVTIEGGEELARQLRRLGLAAADVLPMAVEAGGMVLRDLARPKAPGPEIELEMEKGSGKATATIGPAKKKWYYRFFELGTGVGTRSTKGRFVFRGEDGRLRIVREIDHPGMAARPFLRPAFDEGQDEAVGKAGDALRSRIEGVGR